MSPINQTTLVETALFKNMQWPLGLLVKNMGKNQQTAVTTELLKAGNSGVRDTADTKSKCVKDTVWRNKI